MPGPKDLRHPMAFPRLRCYFLRIRFQHRQQILETDGDKEENPHVKAETSIAASGLDWAAQSFAGAVTHLALLPSAPLYHRAAQPTCITCNLFCMLHFSPFPKVR